MKNPVTPAGNEPATYRFAAQHLNHSATAVPYIHTYLVEIMCCVTNCTLQEKHLRESFESF